MNIFNQINQVGIKNFISLKAVALFVSMLAFSITFSGCSDEETDTNQAEVVFPNDVNLTKINEEEYSIELKQGSSIIPIEIKSNSAWKIYFSFDDERFCFAYPHGGVGNATVELYANKNLSDERCTGKMYISFKEGSTKSKTVHLSQKGNIDNDENGTPPEINAKCPRCGNIFPVDMHDRLTKEGVNCPICSRYIPIDLIEIAKRQDIDALIDKLRNESKFNK